MENTFLTAFGASALAAFVTSIVSLPPIVVEAGLRSSLFSVLIYGAALWPIMPGGELMFETVKKVQWL